MEIEPPCNIIATGGKGKTWMLTPSYLTLLDPPGGNTEAELSYFGDVYNDNRIRHPNKNISRKDKSFLYNSYSCYLTNAWMMQK